MTKDYMTMKMSFRIEIEVPVSVLETDEDFYKRLRHHIRGAVMGVEGDLISIHSTSDPDPYDLTDPDNPPDDFK